MAVGRRDVTFGFGIKQLLCDDNEHNESFWAYFSEFVDAEQPPLTFPISTTLVEGIAVAEEAD